MPLINPPNEFEETLMSLRTDGYWIGVSVVKSILIVLIMGLMVASTQLNWNRAVIGCVILIPLTFLMLKLMEMKFLIYRMLIRHWFGRTKSNETSSVD